MLDRWLARHMDDAHLNDSEVAAAIGSDATTVSRWRRGIKLPERQFIIALARLFKVSPLTILQMTDPNEVEALARDPARQQELVDLLADLPEMGEIAARLAKMTPEKRAAWLLVLRNAE